MHIMYDDKPHGAIGKHIFNAIHGSMGDVNRDDDSAAFEDGEDGDEHVEGAIEHNADFFVDLCNSEFNTE